MPHRSICLAIMLLVLIAGCHGQAAVQEQAPQSPSVSVDSLAQAFFDAHAPPSLVVGVLDGDAQHVWGYGAVDSLGVPDAHTRYEIGSITKVITALTLAEMAARGEVALDEAVAVYLPDSLAVASSMTLERLVTHTAGLPRLAPNFAPQQRPLDPFAPYTVADLYTALDGFEPDTTRGYTYSNFGLGLLGHTLARVSSNAYEVTVRLRVLAPLGMDATASKVPDTSRFAQPHVPPHIPTPAWTFTDATAGAGALRASPADLLTLLAAHLDPPLDLPASLRDALRTAPELWAEVPAEPFNVGLGWHRTSMEDDSGRVIVWHNGGTAGTRSFAGYIRTGEASGVGVVVFTNVTQDVTAFGFDLLARLTAP